MPATGFSFASWTPLRLASSQTVSPIEARSASVIEFVTEAPGPIAIATLRMESAETESLIRTR